MNKLILALALLLTPFFSQFSVAQNVEPESVSPEVDSEKIIVSSNVSQSIIGSIYDGDAQGYCESGGLSGYASVNAINIVPHDSGLDFDCNYVDNAGYSYPSVGGVSFEEVGTKSCPPEAYPNYIYPKDDDGDGEIDACYKDNPALEKCPDGNYKFKVGGECIPVKCSGAGDQSDFWASGNVYSNNAGTYCDGSCAHSVGAGQNDSNYQGSIAITGVSTGEVCGGGGLDDRWQNDGNGKECENTNGFLTCPNGDTPDAPIDNNTTVDLEDEIAILNEIEPLIPIEEVCTAGDTACEVRNLKETITTKGLEQKEIDEILHNKNIKADEKTTKKIADGIAESAGRNAQGLQMVTSAIDGLKDSLGGSNGGNSGTGFGDDDVTCDGDDCEGDVLTDIEPSAGLEGYWESEYEDGLEGMFLEKLEEYKRTEFFVFLDQFKPQLSGGSAPNYNWCFNFGQYMSFGCHNLSIDPRVFPALKIFILISAAFACRAILFGG